MNNLKVEKALVVIETIWMSNVVKSAENVPTVKTAQTTRVERI